MKSFGDFIIARWALRRFGIVAPGSLLFGEHLGDLDNALGPCPGGRVVTHGETVVPSMFDVRKAGLVRSLASALRVRRAFERLALPQDWTLVFDRIGSREKFIAGRHPARALPKTENIYLAYGALYDLSGSGDAIVPAVAHRSNTTVGVFPGSRLQSKTLRADTVAVLRNTLEAAGAGVRIFTLEGEPTDPDMDSADVCVVPRSFASMAEAVRSVDGVVSADSMPAHMAEYFGLPVHVVTPVPNTYWLPLSCWVADRWSVASDTDKLVRDLHGFLHVARQG